MLVAWLARLGLVGESSSPRERTVEPSAQLGVAMSFTPLSADMNPGRARKLRRQPCRGRKKLEALHDKARRDHRAPRGRATRPRAAMGIQRYVVLGDSESLALSLWVLHTHAIEAAFTTPLLSITSAEKECGKTRLLEVRDVLVARPWLTMRTTAAALLRRTDGEAAHALAGRVGRRFSRRSANTPKRCADS